MNFLTVQNSHIFFAHNWKIDDSVPSAFRKAVQSGKFPNLKRIELNECTLSDSYWPQVPELSISMKNLFQKEALASNVTEYVNFAYRDVELFLSVRLPFLSVLKLGFTQTNTLLELSAILKKGKLPNLSCLRLRNLHLADWERLIGPLSMILSQTTKLEKLTLHGNDLTVPLLKMLSEKLTCLPLRELGLRDYYLTSVSGSLSVLFARSFQMLHVLKIKITLTPDDLQSLARACSERKLPQLKHLTILGDTKDLFTGSTTWNQLLSLRTNDANVLKLDALFLRSLEALYLNKGQPTTVARCWPNLREIELGSRTLEALLDGIDKGLFPALKTVRCYSVPQLTLFRLYKANVFVHHLGKSELFHDEQLPQLKF